MWTRVRARLAVWRFLYVNLNLLQGILALAGIISLILGTIRLLASGSSDSAVVLVVGLILLGCSGIKLYRDYVKAPGRTIELNPQVLEVMPSIIGATKVPGTDDYVQRSIEIDRDLRNRDLKIQRAAPFKCRRAMKRIKEQRVEMAMALNAHLHRALGTKPPKEFFNEEKLCLAEEPKIDASTIMVCKGSYFVSLLTNELSTQLVMTSGATPRVAYSGFSLFPVVKYQGGGFRLLPIETTSLGNHIGASAIAFGSDGNMRLWRQKHTALQSGGKLAPTGSGSCDFSDEAPDRSLRRTIAHAMKREFWEESIPKEMRNRRALRSWNTAEQEFDKVVSKVKVLGYFRWLNRGAKPEFVGIVKLKVPAENLYPNVREVDKPDHLPLDYEARTIDQLQDVLLELLNSRTIQLSVPLWVNVICLQCAIRDEPNAIREFLNDPL